MSEVVAANNEVLKDVKALLTKAEETPEKTPEKEEAKGEETTEETTEEKKEDITREEFDALTSRVAELEKMMEEKDEQNAKLTEAVEASTNALNRVAAFFGKPSNRAMLTNGEPVKATVEAGEVTAQKSAAEVWMDMPPGAEREAFFKAHYSEIVNTIK
jgi:hypothetical protein